MSLIEFIGELFAPGPVGEFAVGRPLPSRRPLWWIVTHAVLSGAQS